MHIFENRETDTVVKDCADALGQIEAAYALEIQKHEQMLAKLRESSRRPGTTDDSKSTSQPDMKIRSRRAA